MPGTSGPVSEATAGRLFPDVAAEDLTLSAARSLVLSRLLEDGDEADLRRLFAALPEAEAAAWLERAGGRQLSRRSAAFWRLVLDRESGAEPAVAAELWPL